MKLFWSWQSDTPEAIGRFFVRDALTDAIDALKTDKEITEPSEREAADALRLDADREGVPGSPDLAATILRKIEQSAVFVADVTLIGQTPGGKKLINSNVAIEYGYAHRALTDASILMVQNTHYGERNQLPFDLRHKAGPIQYALKPDATEEEITAEKARLSAVLATELRPYLKSPGPTRKLHIEVPFTYTKAAFFKPSDILASNHAPPPDTINYNFDQNSALYLRLIPIYSRAQPLRVADLYDLALNRSIDLLLRNRYVGAADRNGFDGAIVYEPHGTATVPRAITQAFTNGELWAISTEMFVRWRGQVVIPTTNVKNIFGRVLANFLELSCDSFRNGLPVRIVLGGVGLGGMFLGVEGDPKGPIHRNELEVRKDLQDRNAGTRAAIIETFLDRLFDLAGERR
jgi:hypothetical protein